MWSRCCVQGQGSWSSQWLFASKSVKLTGHSLPSWDEWTRPYCYSHIFELLIIWYFLLQDNREASLFLNLLVLVQLFPRSKLQKSMLANKMRSWRSLNAMNVARRSSATTHCSAISWSTLASKNTSVKSAAKSLPCWNTYSVTNWCTLERSRISVTFVVVPSRSRAVFKHIAAHTLEWSLTPARSVDEHLHCSHLCCPICGHTVRRRPLSAVPVERPSHTETPCPGMNWSTLEYDHLSATNVERPLHRPMISSATAASILVYARINVIFVARPSQLSLPWFAMSVPTLVVVLTSVTTVIRPSLSQVPVWSMLVKIIQISRCLER